MTGDATTNEPATDGMHVAALLTRQSPRQVLVDILATAIVDLLLQAPFHVRGTDAPSH